MKPPLLAWPERLDQKYLLRVGPFLLHWEGRQKPHCRCTRESLAVPILAGPGSGPDYLASDGRSGTRWMVRLWPLVPLTLCCLIVLCGGHNMFFYAEQILFECSVPSLESVV